MQKHGDVSEGLCLLQDDVCSLREWPCIEEQLFDINRVKPNPDCGFPTIAAAVERD